MSRVTFICLHIVITDKDIIQMSINLSNIKETHKDESTEVGADNPHSRRQEQYTNRHDYAGISDVEERQAHSVGPTGVDSGQVGEYVGFTDNGIVVAQEGDGSLSTTDTLKERKKTCIGPQWGEGRTTWHPSDIESALTSNHSETYKEWARGFFAEGSFAKRLTDGTFDDDGGFRHENDVWLTIQNFCEKVGLNGYEGVVKKVYDELPPEPFQPIGGHESANCDIAHHRGHVITDVHPPQNGELKPSPNSEYGWDVESIKLPHDPTTCPRCDQCRCGNFHLGEAPTNGIETRVIGAMLLVDIDRIKSAEDSQEAFSNRLQKRDDFIELANNHAIDYSQARQTAIEHHEAGT